MSARPTHPRPPKRYAHVRIILAPVLWSTVGIGAGLLALFIFLDLTRLLSHLNPQAYDWAGLLLQMLLRTPRHIYNLLPLAILLGSILALTQLAQSSQFTVLRAAGLQPRQLVIWFGGLGLMLSAVIWLTGDLLATTTDNAALNQHERTLKKAVTQLQPIWLQETTATANRFVSAKVESPTQLSMVHIEEFDNQGRLQHTWKAQTATLPPQASASAWVLHQAQHLTWPASTPVQASLAQATSVGDGVVIASHEQIQWPTRLNSALAIAALTPSDNMNSWQLWTYVQHLQQSQQSTQRYWVALWGRIFYALSAVALLFLSLPFAYAQPRKNASVRSLLLGLLAGIGYVLLHSVLSQLSVLRNWPVLITAALPLVLYLSAAGLWLRRVWRLN